MVSRVSVSCWSTPGEGSPSSGEIVVGSHLHGDEIRFRQIPEDSLLILLVLGGTQEQRRIPVLRIRGIGRIDHGKDIHCAQARVGPGAELVIGTDGIHAAGAGQAQHLGQLPDIARLGGAEDLHHLVRSVFVLFAGGDPGHGALRSVGVDAGAHAVAQGGVPFDPELIAGIRQCGNAHDTGEHHDCQQHCQHSFHLFHCFDSFLDRRADGGMAVLCFPYRTCYTT